MNMSQYNVANSMIREGKRHELIAQNIAGAGNVGFKGRYLVGRSFEESLREVSGEVEPQGVNGVVVNFEQGAMKNTGRSLDFCLVGKGFFEVTAPGDAGKFYTRNGTFSLNTDGVLVNSTGYPVAGESGDEIKFPPNINMSDIEVAQDGTIKVQTQLQKVIIGKIKVTDFEKADKLPRVSADLFMNTGQAGEQVPVPDTAVVNNTLEQSNISPVKEMATMIQSVRNFEQGQKIMQMISQMSREEVQKIVAN